MISTNDKIAVANLTTKKLLGVKEFIETLNVKANVIGGWTEDKNENDVLREKHELLVFNNSREFFTNYETQNNPVTIIFITQIDECEKEIKEIISYNNIQIKAFIIATIPTTVYKSAMIKNLCKEINAEAHFVSLDTKRAYELLKKDEIIWTYNELDKNIENELQERKINSGRFLDVGAGLCTQSYNLAKRGFDVIATDISKEALELAQSYIKDVEIDYLVDNIIDTKITEEVDYILDRGCFHCLELIDRPKYINAISKILKPNGILFLKVFDKNCSVHTGPKLFSKIEIIDLFSEGFKIEKIEDSFIVDNSGRKFNAIFAVIRCIKS